MYTLGIGDVTHDVSVALAKNGKIVAVCEYERLIRIKHTYNFKTKNYSISHQSKEFPNVIFGWDVNYRINRINQCINYCLEQEDITLADIDLFVTSTLYEHRILLPCDAVITHHLAHASSTFFASPFDQSAILTIDACGEIINYQSESATFTLGKNNHIKKIKNIKCFYNLTPEEKLANIGLPHMVNTNTLGPFYQNMTILIGMDYFCEGKSMGLSAYGKPNTAFDFIRDYVKLLPEGEFTINNRAIFLELRSVMEQATAKLASEALFCFKADAAYIHQKILEEVIIHMCNYLYKETKLKNLCLAGGVALNSVANGKIIKNTPFESVFIQPAAGDNGIAIGCAMYGECEIKKHKKIYNNNNIFLPYLGKEYYSDKTAEFTKDLITFPIEKSVHKTAAQMIADGYIIAWYNGRSEIGPRALGNRSILADPRLEAMKDILNTQVKHREAFRPFAPAALLEYANEYFIMDEPSPYMTIVAEVRPEKRYLIPAVTHIDGTARLQTVTKDFNYDFYRLIEEFYLITEVPILLNTSFNDAGQPIVETPAEAITAFLKMNIDALALNNKIYVKEHVFKELTFDITNTSCEIT